jgi:hypothetical protein
MTDNFMLGTPSGISALKLGILKKRQIQSFAARFFKVTGNEKTEVHSVYRKTKKAV